MRHDPELLAAARHFGPPPLPHRHRGRRRARLQHPTCPARGAAGATELDAARITEDPFTLGVASGDPLPDSVAAVDPARAPPRTSRTAACPQQHVTVQLGTGPRRALHRASSARGTGRSPTPSSTTPCTSTSRASTPTASTTTASGPAPGSARVGPHPHRPGHAAPRLATLTLRRRLLPGLPRRLLHRAPAPRAEDDVDVVFHLGDYLYEYAVNAAGGARNYTDRKLPALFNRETITLEDYRLRYALYKSDPDLRAAHAAHPFVVTWDDHETENNYAGDIRENDDPAGGVPACAGPPPTARTGRTSRCARPQQPERPRHAALPPAPVRARSPSSTSSTPASTAPTRRTATAGTSRAPSPDDPARTMTGADPGALAARRLARLAAPCGTSLPQQVTFSQRKLDLTPDRPAVHGRLGRLPGLPRPDPRRREVGRASRT